MASVMQGDAYNIPVTIKSGNGTLITPEIAACVEITVGQFTKRWPGQVTFDEKTGEWQFPVTQKQTFRFLPGTAMVQARVVFQDGSIMGGSGAPVRVEQSASRGTLPQPEKTEAATGSAPKATEVTIPTVHDIDVSLHSQVILSDPIKAPYIGENGNWYEYDAETGTFVDTGTSASGIPPIAPDTAGKYLTNDGSKAEWGVPSGGSDLSLGITGARVGQIVKITAVDDSGKPTAWKAVNDRLPEVTPSEDGKALYVERIGEHEYGYGFTNIPNIYTFIPLGITDASPGQFARIKFVDDIGQPTAWEAVDMDAEKFPKFTKLLTHTITQDELDSSPIAFVWGTAQIPNLNDFNVFTLTIRNPDNTTKITFTKWVKLKINNVIMGNICGTSQGEGYKYSISANRLYGFWVSDNIYNPNNDDTNVLTPPYSRQGFDSNLAASEAVTSIGFTSYVGDYGLTAGIVVEIWGAK